jgi:putative peptidoglycan lipid II flippase
VPLGPLGLALGATIGAWLEWALLKRALRSRLGVIGAGAAPLVRMFAAALAAAAGAYGVSRAMNAHALLEALGAAAAFGALYLALAVALRIPQASAVVAALRRRLGRG